MESKKIPKVLLFEIALFFDGPSVIKLTKLNKAMSDTLFLEVYMSNYYPKLKFEKLKLLRKEKLFLLYHYPNGKYLDLLDFQPYYSNCTFH